MSNYSVLECPQRGALLDHQTRLKSTECRLCHYSEKLTRNFKFPVASRGTGRILVVGNWTLKEEHDAKALGGAFASVFEEYLQKYTGLSSVDCVFTYAIKCNDGNEISPKALEYRNCSRYLLQEIKLIDPTLILFIGKDSAKSVMDNKLRTKVATGTAFQTFILGKNRWCYFITNPVIAKSNTAAVSLVQAQFKGIASFLQKNTSVYSEITQPVIEEVKEREYSLVDTLPKLKEMKQDLDQYTLIGMDTETNSLHTWSNTFKLVGISLAATETKGYYIPVGHNFKNVLQLDWNLEVKPIIKNIVDDPTKQTVWHNLYYDYAALKVSGLDIFKVNPSKSLWTHDSMLMSYLCNENSPLGLKDQMYRNFNISPQKFKGVLASADVNTFDNVTPEKALKYAADDAINCLMLFKKSAKVVKKESKLYTNNKLITEIYPTELKTIKILADAHLRGICVDSEYVEQLILTLNTDLIEVHSEVLSLSNMVSNINSNTKLLSLLKWVLTPTFNKLFIKKYKSKQKKLDVQKRTIQLLITLYTSEYVKAEKYKTDLPGKWKSEKLSKYFTLVLRYRHLGKVKSTYLEPISENMQQDKEGNWIIHANIKSIGTTSGRMSSRNPNLQNIPRSVPSPPSECESCKNSDDDNLQADTTLSKFTCKSCKYVNKTWTYDLRRIYIPRPGMKFVAADYVGMELYLAAAVSGCQNLYDVFLTKEKDPNDPNGDMHVVTASSILKITPDQWQTMLTLNDTTNKKAKHFRQLAKTVNYLALYGGSPEGLQATFLSQGLEYTVEECQEFLNAFFVRFPEIKIWFSEMKYEIAKNGRLINNYGRIRHVLKRGGEVLSAINMLIQGLGAQIIKESLVNMSEDWKDINRFPLLVIHDENVIEVSEDDLLSTAKSMLVHMQITVKDKLNVKLLVDVLAGLSSLSKADKGVKLNYGS